MAGLPNLDDCILPWVVERKKRKVEIKREEGRKRREEGGKKENCCTVATHHKQAYLRKEPISLSLK